MHGRYSRAEIEAAFGILTADAPWIHREGVLRHQATTCDLLFITLRLPVRTPACRRHWSEALFSPATHTRNLAVGPSLFHWESHGDPLAAGAGDPGGVAARLFLPPLVLAV